MELNNDNINDNKDNNIEDKPFKGLTESASQKVLYTTLKQLNSLNADSPTKNDLNSPESDVCFTERSKKLLK